MYQKVNSSIVSKGAINSFKEIFSPVRIFLLAVMHTPFAVHNTKLSQEKCFVLPIYYTVLCIGRSTKDATDRFFHTAH